MSPVKDKVENPSNSVIELATPPLVEETGTLSQASKRAEIADPTPKEKSSGYKEYLDEVISYYENEHKVRITIDGDYLRASRGKSFVSTKIFLFSSIDQLIKDAIAKLNIREKLSAILPSHLPILQLYASFLKNQGYSVPDASISYDSFCSFLALEGTKLEQLFHDRREPTGHLIPSMEDGTASRVDRTTLTGGTGAAGEISDGRNALPTRAPVLWADREDRAKTPPQFIKDTYGEWLGRGFHTGTLHQLDPELSKALSNWKRTHALPDDFHLPSRSDVLAAEGALPTPEDVKEARRVLGRWATRQEAIRKRNNQTPNR